MNVKTHGSLKPTNRTEPKGHEMFRGIHAYLMSWSDQRTMQTVVAKLYLKQWFEYKRTKCAY